MRATVLFLSVMVHCKVVFFLVFAFVCFYFAIFAGPRFVKIQNFATRQRDVTKNYPLFRAQIKE